MLSLEQLVLAEVTTIPLNRLSKLIRKSLEREQNRAERNSEEFVNWVKKVDIGVIPDIGEYVSVGEYVRKTTYREDHECEFWHSFLEGWTKLTSI